MSEPDASVVGSDNDLQRPPSKKRNTGVPKDPGSSPKPAVRHSNAVSTRSQPNPTKGNTDWFVHDRFGMFIHWGLYALPARHEWIKSREKVTDAAYERYFRHFNPTRFDPEQWAERAQAAGMRYMVITSKHHEGFCLWDTRHTDYKVTNTPYGRDLLAPVVDAFRNRGLKVCHAAVYHHQPMPSPQTCTITLRHHPLRAP